MPTSVKIIVGVTLVYGVLAILVIAAWIAFFVLRPEQAIRTADEALVALFYELAAPLAIGLVSGVLSGLVVAMMLESKRGAKSDLATGAPPPGAAPSPAAKETE